MSGIILHAFEPQTTKPKKLPTRPHAVTINIPQHSPQKNSMHQKTVNRTQVMTPLTQRQAPRTSIHTATGSPALLTCARLWYGNSQQMWAFAKDPTWLQGWADVGTASTAGNQAQGAPKLSQFQRQNETFHKKKKFLKLPQLNSPDVISFVAIRLRLLFHILIKTTQTKIICLLKTLFFP